MQGNTTDNPHIAFAVLATDVAMFTLRDGELLVRMMRVERPPYFNNVPGLPGGLIKPTETAEETVKRIAYEKAGISHTDISLEQLYTFSEVDRDPRGRVVAVAYLAFIPWEKLTSNEQTDTPDLWWQSCKKLPQLAYDHNHVLKVALERIRSRIRYTSMISTLMPTEFTLTNLEQAYESILGKDIDKRNFRKKILSLGVLKSLAKKQTGTAFRPAQLYSFKKKGIFEIEMIT